MSVAGLEYHGSSQLPPTSQPENYSTGQALATATINVTQPQQKTIPPPPPDYSINWATPVAVSFIAGPLPILIIIILVCFVNHFDSKAKKQYAGGDHEAAYRSSHTAAAIRACGLCCAAPIVTALPIVMVLLFAISGIIGSQN
ncbi:hypothetical protein EMCRGX_G000171 [Ephydatia muelleri]